MNAQTHIEESILSLFYLILNHTRDDVVALIKLELKLFLEGQEAQGRNTEDDD